MKTHIERYTNAAFLAASQTLLAKVQAGESLTAEEEARIRAVQMIQHQSAEE